MPVLPGVLVGSRRPHAQAARQVPSAGLSGKQGNCPPAVELVLVDQGRGEPVEPRAVHGEQLVALDAFGRHGDHDAPIFCPVSTYR